MFAYARVRHNRRVNNFTDRSWSSGSRARARRLIVRSRRAHRDTSAYVLDIVDLRLKSDEKLPVFLDISELLAVLSGLLAYS